MLGRLIQSNPFLLKRVDNFIYNENILSEVNEDIIYNYFDYIAPKIQYESIFRLLSPLLNIFFGIPDSKKFKSEIHAYMKKPVSYTHLTLQTIVSG